MDAFPDVALVHNAPLVLVSGLSSEAKPMELHLGSIIDDAAITIHSELPSVDTQVAAQLQNYFSTINATCPPWDADYNDSPYRFRAITTGRTIRLPPRKAQLPPDIEVFPQSPPALHSPFSPLSTTSRLYPDGILDVAWMRKHQELIPSVVLCFYNLTSDPTQAQALDNNLKSDIANIRSFLQKSGHKIRLVAVLLSDASAPPLAPTDGITDRLESIRRGSGLDSKAIYYVSPKDSPEELNIAADKILTALYPVALEHYRDLGRRSKKKKGRGLTPMPTVPPTSGTSQTLSLADWNVRYDFKIAVFSEFRQDMDNACKSYEAAYDGLTSQEVWEMIPGWGSRWNEARFLADIIAIRWIRCLLWNGNPTAAVRRWQFHRDLSADMVERCGRGTNNYGWEAWQARWFVIMAQLIENMSLPEMPPFKQAVFLPPEKAILGERLRPWDSLHHTGYWYRAAARHQAARRRLAYAIPQDDRKRPENPLAHHQKMQKDYLYDTYLCPEPYEEYAVDGKGTRHGQLIVDCLLAARKPFEDRGQYWAMAEITLECAKELTALGQAERAVEILFPLWKKSVFRGYGWFDVAEEVCWSLRRAAVKANRGDVVVSVDWELLSNRFSRKPKWPYDLSRSLDDVKLTEKPMVEIMGDDILSFISPVLLFRHKEARAGETCYAELQITTNTFPDAAPFTFKELFIEFEGGIGPVTLTHDESLADKIKTVGKTTLNPVQLEEEKTEEEQDEVAPALFGSSVLTFRPAHTTVFYLPIPLREPGETQALGVTFLLDNEAFSLVYTARFSELRKLNGWYDPQTLRRTTIARENPQILDIQPRPPKMEIVLVTPLQQYYTNEMLAFEVDVVNAEDEDITAKVDVLVAAAAEAEAVEAVPEFELLFGGENATSVVVEEGAALSNAHIGKISKLKKMAMVVRISPFEIPTECEISIKVSYHLDSDPATPIIQTTSFRVAPKAPFEARYDLLPRLHPDPWPSIFGTEGLGEDEDLKRDRARGLAQRWLLKTAYQSLAAEEIFVMGVDVHVISFGENNAAVCDATLLTETSEAGTKVRDGELQTAEFQLDCRKKDLDDRSSSLLELAFDIHWVRVKPLPLPSVLHDRDSAVRNVTSIVIPPYMILGTEPRVLATLVYPPTAPKGLLVMDVTIENASGHFLTFGLTMDPSDQFAFSGAKLTTVNVLPVSRRTVQFRLWPMVTGTYIRPGLIVKDRYYQKILKIIGTDGMGVDKEGLLIWVPHVEGG